MSIISQHIPPSPTIPGTGCYVCHLPLHLSITHIPRNRLLCLSSPTTSLHHPHSQEPPAMSVIFQHISPSPTFPGTACYVCHLPAHLSITHIPRNRLLCLSSPSTSLHHPHSQEPPAVCHLPLHLSITHILSHSSINYYNFKLLSLIDDFIISSCIIRFWVDIQMYTDSPLGLTSESCLMLSPLICNYKVDLNCNVSFSGILQSTPTS